MYENYNNSNIGNGQNNTSPRYSYEGYGGRDASELYGQRLYPDTGTTQLQAEIPNPPNEAPQRKPRKAPRIIAAALGMALIGGAAGGGAAWYVVSQNQIVAPAASSTAIVQPTAIVSGTTTDISGVVSKAANSVVEIVTRSPGNPFAFQSTSSGAGSGVILTEDGYIVTNNHVIESAKNITVLTKDGVEYEATLIGTDAKTDLAVIKVEATGLTPANLADSDSIQVGQLAVAIGNPLGELGGTVTSGIISATGREMTIDNESMTLLQTSAAVNPGNSGGGLFDQNGDLVGVVNAKSSGFNVEGLGFAIPANTVKTVTDELIQNGYVTGRPQMGISVIEVSDPYALAMYGLQNPGVYIASDENPSGLEAGDRIVSIDGEIIESSTDISGILANHKVGDILTLILERESTEVTAQVTLIEQVPETVRSARSEI